MVGGVTKLGRQMGQLALCTTSPQMQAFRWDLKDVGFYRHSYPGLLPLVGNAWTDRDEKKKTKSLGITAF